MSVMISVPQQVNRGLTAVMGLCVVLVTGLVAAINLAIPSLAASSLRPGPSAVLWIVDSYVVVFACLLIPAGVLADRWGRKGVLLAGLGLFAAGLTLSGLAWNVPVLLAGRVVTGVGAAAVLPNTLALLVAVAAPERRARTVAVWSSMAGIAGLAGNVGGGAVLALGSWRTLFFGLLPLAVLAFALVARLAPKVGRHDRPVDLVSALLLTLGFVALLYGIIEGPGLGWGHIEVLTALVAAALLLLGWVGYELRVSHPLVDPRIFRIPLARASSLGVTVVFLGMFGLFFLNGQYLQYGQGFSTLGAGLGLLPMAGTLALTPRLSLVLANRIGQRATIALGLVLLTIGLGALSTVGAHTPYVLYALGTMVAATGCGLAMAPLSHGIMASLPHHRAGLGSGLQGLTRELGSALGVAIAGTVVTAVGRGNFVEGMGAGLRVLAAVVLVSAVIVVLWLPRSQQVEVSAD